MVPAFAVSSCGIFCFVCIAFVAGGGKVQIRLSQYRNNNGAVHKTNGGIGCCDSTTLVPPSCDPAQCDPVIDICISEFRTPGRCDSKHARLPTFHDTAAITFNITLGLLEFPFAFWGGAVFVKATVSDGGGKNFEKMVYMIDSVSASTPVMSGETAWYPLVLASDGVSLVMDINVMCDEHYRDKFCNCRDRNTTFEHTMCDRQGNRVCLSGWANLPQKCLTPTSTCLRQNPCKNNASCGTYTNKTTNKETIVCTCPLDYSGKYCGTYTSPQTSPIITTSTIVTTTPTPTTRTTFRISTTPSTSVTSHTSNNITMTTQYSNPAVTSQSSNQAVTTHSSSHAVTTQFSSQAMTTKSSSQAMTTQSSSQAMTTQSSSQTMTTQPSSKAVTTHSSKAVPTQYSSNIVSAQSSSLTTVSSRPGARGGGRTTPGSSSGNDNIGIIAGIVAAVGLLGAIAATLIILRKRIFKTAQNAVDDSAKATEEEITESPRDAATESNQTNVEVEEMLNAVE